VLFAVPQPRRASVSGHHQESPLPHGNTKPRLHMDPNPPKHAWREDGVHVALDALGDGFCAQACKGAARCVELQVARGRWVSGMGMHFK
jgi:hypothetical protein